MASLLKPEQARKGKRDSSRRATRAEERRRLSKWNGPRTFLWPPRELLSVAHRREGRFGEGMDHVHDGKLFLSMLHIPCGRAEMLFKQGSLWVTPFALLPRKELHT